MCYGYRGSARWWDSQAEQRWLELLEQEERERGRERRDILRARQDEELQRLEKTLTTEKPKVGTR